MRNKFLKKMLPVILAFALVVPTGSVQNPVIAADDDGVSSEQGTGELAEGVYSLPLKAYDVKTTNNTSTETITQTRPAWNERAMVTVASGGAISLTLQIYSTIPYDAFQVMKPETSSAYNFSPVTNADNQALAKVPMGTFNLPEGYMEELASFTNVTDAADSFSDSAAELYYGMDKVSKRVDTETGFTYLTLALDSLEQLNEKLVIKAAFALDKAGYPPVTTTYFIFQRENMVYVPDLEEFDDASVKSVEVSNLRAGSVALNTATPSLGLITDGVKKTNIQTLFADANIEVTEAVSGSSITVSGSLNSDSIDDYANTGIHYGVLLVREYQGRTYLPAKEDTNIYVYNRPYQNYEEDPLFKSIDIADNTYQLEYDYSVENLIFGVPLNIVCEYDTSKMTRANLGTFTELTLGQLTSTNFVMFHILPEEVEPVVLYDSSSYDNNEEVRVTSDTGVISGDSVLTVGSAEGKQRNEALKPVARQAEDELYLKGYTYDITTASGAAVSLQKNVEIAVKIPDGWAEGELYAWYVAPKADGTYYNVLYAPNSADPNQKKVTVEDGYAIFNTTYSSGELYLYEEDQPSDLNALADGTYRVRVAAMHAASTGVLSMSNSAMEPEAILVVRTGTGGSKVKELYLNFQALYITSEPAYLSKAGTATNYDYDDDDKSGITWGDTLDYFTAAEGSEDLMVDDWYKENYDYDIYLPRSEKITLQDYTGADSESELYKDYYPVYFEVPPMDSDPTDGITIRAVRLMVNNCVKLEDGTVLPTYQKTVLKKAILEGEAIDGEVYTTDSFGALQTAIGTAKEAYNSNPDAEAIKNNAAAVQAAINALTVDESKKADKSALEARLAEAKAIVGDNYTASSYTDLQTAITAAEKIYEKAAAAQAEVDAQVDALEAAIAALVFIDLGAVAPGELPEGTYTIPIRLWHAIKDSASMGDAAVISTGILTIQKDENGNKKATLQFEMKALTFAGLTGYLMQFDTLSGYTIGTGGYPENYTKNPATVLETYDVVDMYNSEDSKDAICRGQKYPKTLQIDVTLPETTGVDYTWVHVYVPVMGELDSGDQEARLRLDYTAIAKKGEPTISLDYASVELTPGGTKTLTAALTDSEEAIVWTTDNGAVATVNNNGLVTAIAVGTATITAAAGNISASCMVTVTAADTDGGTGGSGGSGGTGGSGDGLEDGTYSIPVKLWHAQKDQTSMGNAALTQTARLVIKNGEGTLYVTFKGMTYAGQKGYLAELNPSTVITTYNVVDQFNREDSTDERCRGIKYPKLLAVPVNPGEEFTDVSVYVPVMGSLGVGEQDARLKLNYSSARYVSSSTKQESSASDDDLYFDEGEATESTAEESAEETKELVTVDGVNYFYENGEKLISQLITYSGNKYYAGEDGAVLTSQFIIYEGNKYYATKSGAIAIYIMITDNNKTYFAGKEGVIVVSDMVDYEGKRYYAYKTGRIAVSAMVTYQNNKYYSGKDGAIVTTAMVTNKGKKYYAYKTGIIATSAIVTYNNKKYYAYKTGRIAASAMVTNNGKKYYAWKTGRIAASTMVTYKGKKYYAWKTGRIATSTLVTYKGKKYYVGKTGQVATSTLVTYNGKKYYAGKTGEAVTSKWVTIGKTKYYFDKTGKLIKTVKI